MESLLQNLRYALRRLAGSPGFTAAAVLTLALGIGANTAVFSVVQGVLLKPLPYPSPGRTVMIWNRWTGWPRTWLSEPEVADYRRETDLFEAVAPFTYGAVNLTGDGEPERLRAGLVGADIFSVLGIVPALGRPFSAAEDAPGGAQVVLLGDGLWRRRYGADPGTVGRTIFLNGEAATVVGVMPPTFRLPLDFTGPEATLWMPLSLGTPDETNRGSHYLNAAARIRNGLTLEAAQAGLDALSSRLRNDHDESYGPSFGIGLVPVNEQIRGDIRPTLWLVAGGVGLVLLIACSNVAGLLLVRAEGRHRELAVRRALGAGTRDLARQFFAESLLLATLGGAVGLVVAFWAVDLLPMLRTSTLPQTGDISISLPVLAFTAGLVALTTVAFTLIPIWRVSRGAPEAWLREGGRGGGAAPSRVRFRRGLLAAELALAVLITVAAGLLLRSFVRLAEVDPGFHPDRVLTLRLSPPPVKYSKSSQVRQFYATLLLQLQQIPGTREAGAVSDLPLASEPGDWSFEIEGRPAQDPHEPSPAADWLVATPGYLPAIGMTLVRGRWLEATDRWEAGGVVVINEETARRYWPDQDPLGARIRLGGSVDSIWRTVVGVVANVRHNSLAASPRPQMFLPHAQFPRSMPDSAGGVLRSMTLVLRSQAEPSLLSAAATRTIRELDPDLPVAAVQSGEAVLSDAVSTPRFTLVLFGVFAGLALLLSGIGVYSVLAYAVALRTREIGVRVALGAQVRDVLRIVMEQGLPPIAGGIAAGLFGAFALQRAIRHLLFEVSPTDMTAWVGATAVLAAVAALASYLPARRAARVDPMVALRSE